MTNLSTFRMISDDGSGLLYVVGRGSRRLNFRGEEWTLEGVSRAPEGSSTGSIEVSRPCIDCDHYWHADGIERGEYYPSVFSVRIVSRLSGPMLSLYEIQDRHEGLWFDYSTMRFWRTRLSERVYPTWNGTYFVSSESIGTGRSRAASIRFADLGGDITTVGEFQGYPTMAHAHRAAHKAMLADNRK